jgi:dihydroorotase
MGRMVAAGAVAFSDDGTWVTDGDVMRRALEYARTFDLAIISHAEDPTLVGKGVMHEGAVSTVLGLAGIPAAAEEAAIFRDLSLAELTGSRLHVAHVSTAGGVELIRRAKARGVPVTAEAASHHLTLTDEAVRSFDPVFKVNPPLRTDADVKALREGLADGTIDCIVSDHAPHESELKDLEFDNAPFGMIGLESTLPVVLTELVNTGVLDWPAAVATMTTGPARALGLPVGTLAEGALADVTVIDPDAAWTIDAGNFRSLSRNCPWQGVEVRGRAEAVLVGGVRRL